MLRRLEALNEHRAAHGETPLEIGIGLHSGKVVAGSVGSPELLQYAYVGDTVNTASRIERMTRELERPLLISSETLERAGGRQAWKAEPMGRIELRGRREPLALWALTVPQCLQRTTATACS